MRALLVFFLLVVILTPGLLMGFLVSPWFFLILFSLLLLFPIFLAPMPEDLDSLGSSRGQESTEPPVWILIIGALIFALPVVIMGFLLIPEFFLLILLVMAPLLYLMIKA
jgi:hypothetical protein